MAGKGSHDPRQVAMDQAEMAHRRQEARGT